MPIRIKSQRWVFVAGVNGLLGVAMGAVGAHAAIAPAAANLIERASLYQLIHAICLLALTAQAGHAVQLARLSFVTGIILFCGSLYGKALLGWPSVLAPAGGIFLMLGWLFVAIMGMRRVRS